MYWLHRGKSDDYKKPRDLSLAKVSTASSDYSSDRVQLGGTNQAARPLPFRQRLRTS
jgi:hypothetical protein